ncbi:hypothetical protein [Carboxydothermus hydrogenoformans]|nr:hypothetical protein [Carboxydothermus hydrogenoformans]
MPEGRVIAMEINAKGMYYRDLNNLLREKVAEGVTEFTLQGINGQRYLGTGLKGKVKIEVYGTPGNDLGAFMDGPEIIVYGNGQDGIANTMNDGRIVVHGHAGDVLGYGMRGGELYIRDSVGYRVGIHMKEYKKQVPVIVVGGTAGAFFGEYMAGGILVVLGLNKKEGEPLTGDYLGTGMHGGVIYLRGEVEKDILGKEVAEFELTEEDYKRLNPLLENYANFFNVPLDEIKKVPFKKLVPVSHRPYGKLYTY